MAVSRVARQQRHFAGLCLAFPGAVETSEDAQTVYRVGREEFARFVVEEDSAKALLRMGDEELSSSQGGVVTLELTGHVDWEEIRGLLLRAFVAVAPKKRLQELDEALVK